MILLGAISRGDVRMCKTYSAESGSLIGWETSSCSVGKAVGAKLSLVESSNAPVPRPMDLRNCRLDLARLLIEFSLGCFPACEAHPATMLHAGLIERESASIADNA